MTINVGKYYHKWRKDLKWLSSDSTDKCWKYWRQHVINEALRIRNYKEIVANKETVEIFDTLGKDLTNLILIGYIKGMASRRKLWVTYLIKTDGGTSVTVATKKE